MKPGEALDIRFPPRIVKPRRESDTADKPLIVVDTHEILVERTGEILPATSLAELTAAEPSSIIVCERATLWLKKLNDHFDKNPRWQFRVSPIEREQYAPDREKTTTVRDTVVAFWGFQRSNGHSQSLYHYPIDPIAFIGKAAREIVPDYENSLDALRQWGEDIRAFCRDNRIGIKPTSGGIAAQFLRDKRFYPNPRRKVPAATNETARKHLPGNHYRLHTKERQFHKALYYDQTRAHHSCARDISFPHADSLYVRGYFHNPDEHRIWAKAGSRVFNRVIQQHGLFKLSLYVPPFIRLTDFPPPFMEDPGHRIVYVFSNELPDIERLGARIEGIIAAWTSPDTDKGLSQFSEWASKTLDESSPARQSWLKPTLLATYGILAAKPKRMEFGFKRAKSGTRKRYPIGGELLEVIAKCGRKAREMGATNVIHRGMIEAETRRRSLNFARELSGQNCQVISIYADSVFIEADCQPPLTPSGWKIEAALDNLRFFNPVQFTSKQLRKLPGIPEPKTLAHLRRVDSLLSVRKHPSESSDKRPRKLDTFPTCGKA